MQTCVCRRNRPLYPSSWHVYSLKTRVDREYANAMHVCRRCHRERDRDNRYLSIEVDMLARMLDRTIVA
eukprot:9476375-Pyramimonas_sp.AAC.1